MSCRENNKHANMARVPKAGVEDAFATIVVRIASAMNIAMIFVGTASAQSVVTQ